MFVQIGDENVHRIRAVMDEVMGPDNFVAEIVFEKTSSTSTDGLAAINDYILWFSKSRSSLKFRPPLREKVLGEAGTTQYTWFSNDDGSDRRLSAQEIANQGLVDLRSVFACDNLTANVQHKVPTFDHSRTKGMSLLRACALGRDSSRFPAAV
jgi:adenine-specific DNA-methyltransferase